VAARCQAAGGRGRLRRPSVAKVADVAARKSKNRGAATARYAVTIGRQAIGYSSKETVKEAGKRHAATLQGAKRARKISPTLSALSHCARPGFRNIDDKIREAKGGAQSKEAARQKKARQRAVSRDADVEKIDELAADKDGAQGSVVQNVANVAGVASPISKTTKAARFAVTDGRETVGYVIEAGDRFEARTVAGRLIGTYPTLGGGGAS